MSYNSRDKSKLTHLVRNSFSLASGYILRYGTMSNLTNLPMELQSFLKLLALMSCEARPHTQLTVQCVKHKQIEV